MNVFASQGSEFAELSILERFGNEIRELCEKQNRWLLVHSGSRIFGANTVDYHETIASRESDVDSLIKYLSGSIISKDAISAKKGEPVIIPFSMSEGAILCRGNSRNQTAL
jgi:RNA-splicing ligase RtcB